MVWADVQAVALTGPQTRHKRVRRVWPTRPTICPLTTLRERLIKIEAKAVRHSKYVTFQMTELAVPRDWMESFVRVG